MSKRKKNTEVVKSENVYGRVPHNLKAALRKYVATQKGSSESQVINEALESYLQIKELEQKTDKIELSLEKIIKQELSPKFERIIAFLIKDAKASYTSIFFQAYVLATIFEADDEKEFVKRKLELANQLAYKVVTSPYLANDISKLIPNDLNFENLI